MIAFKYHPFNPDFGPRCWDYLNPDERVETENDLAIVCCANGHCAKATTESHNIHENGRLDRPYVCPVCKWTDDVVLVGWDSKKCKHQLFAIMVEIMTPKGWMLSHKNVYVHARNVEQARSTFFNANRFSGRRIAEGGNGIAPVIGYKIVDDEHKKLILSV